MKKIITIMLLILVLTSCEMTQMTTEEMILKKQQCEKLGLDIYSPRANFIYCSRNTKIMKCIKEYTRGLDEKYNNPDIVTNLREDNYSNVVKACNEVFGKNK